MRRSRGPGRRRCTQTRRRVLDAALVIAIPPNGQSCRLRRAGRFSRVRAEPDGVLVCQVVSASGGESSGRNPAMPTPDRERLTELQGGDEEGGGGVVTRPGAEPPRIGALRRHEPGIDGCRRQAPADVRGGAGNHLRGRRRLAGGRAIRRHARRQRGIRRPRGNRRRPRCSGTTISRPSSPIPATSAASRWGIGHDDQRRHLPDLRPSLRRRRRRLDTAAANGTGAHHLAAEKALNMHVNFNFQEDPAGTCAPSRASRSRSWSSTASAGSTSRSAASAAIPARSSARTACFDRRCGRRTT